MVHRLIVAKLAVFLLCLMVGIAVHAQNIPQFSSDAAKAAWIQSHPSEYSAAGGHAAGARNTSEVSVATVPTLSSPTANKIGTDANVNPVHVQTRASETGEGGITKIAEPITPLSGPMEDLDEETFKTYSPEKRQFVLDHPEKFRLVKYGETSK